MENKTKDIAVTAAVAYVCFGAERFIKTKLEEGWSVEVIQDSIIKALQDFFRENGG